MSQPTARPKARGFTLIELVVVIVVLAILAAVAVPKFIDLSKAARIARVKAAYGAVAAAANGATLQCRMTNGCFVAAGPGVTMTSPGGVTGPFWYGAPTGRTVPGFTLGIKEFLTVDGLSVVEVDNNVDDFISQDAPDPDNCKVRYVAAYSTPGFPLISMFITGC